MSCGIKFLCENLMNYSELSLTTGTENAQFPLNNIKSVTTARKFRANEPIVTIVADLQQTREIDSIAFVGDHVENIGATFVEIRTSLTTDFSSSPLYRVDINEQQNLGYLFIDQVEHRFVEITVTRNGDFAELSNIFIGKALHLEYQNLSIESFTYTYDDNSNRSENRYGTKFIDKRNLQKMVSGDIQHCTISEMDSLDEMFIAAATHTPIWMFPDEEGSSFTNSEYKLSIYGYLESYPQWTASGGKTYSTSISLKEVV